MRTGEGDRLRAFVESRWGRGKGGMRGLCRETQISAETLYGWFRGEGEPSLGSLDKLAAALDVRRFQIVAAMDGDGPAVALDEATREAMREEMRPLLQQLLEEERRREPARKPRAPADAA